MQSVNIIGAGRLGRSLGRLLHDSSAFEVRAILNRSPAAAREARDFIGAGEVLADFAALPAADFYLLSVPDGQIAACALALVDAGVVPAGAVVFHASGACESSLLAPLRASGVLLASLHPAYSFADPARAAAGFAGTLCALEGDEPACERLEVLTRAIGGRPFRLAEGGKAAYHASLSMASNFLVTLTAQALRLSAQAGVPEPLAGELVGNLMRQTLENALSLGPAAALTGPIVRGDAATVAAHLAIMPDEGLAAAYRAMGLQTLELAGDRLGEEARRALLRVLGRENLI